MPSAVSEANYLEVIDGHKKGAPPHTIRWCIMDRETGRPVRQAHKKKQAVAAMNQIIRDHPDRETFLDAGRPYLRESIDPVHGTI